MAFRPLKFLSGLVREAGYALFEDSGLTTDRTFTLPNQSGTFALTSQLGAICAFDYSTAVESTSSTSFTDTSLSVSVTPTSVSDKVLIRALLHGGGDHAGHFVLTDGSNTILAQGDTNSSRARVHTSVYTSGNSPTLIHVAVMEWVLTPGSTSEQTYKVRWRKNSAAGSTIYLNRSGVTFSDNDAWPVCVSTLFAQVLRA